MLGPLTYPRAELTFPFGLKLHRKLRLSDYFPPKAPRPGKSFLLNAVSGSLDAVAAALGRPSGLGCQAFSEGILSSQARYIVIRDKRDPGWR